MTENVKTAGAVGRGKKAVDAIERMQGVDRMNGRDDQVAGFRGAQRRFDRVAVAHFADDDDVRIVTHQGADDIGDGVGRVVGHRSLIDQRHVIFDRRFDRINRARRTVDFLNDTVKRGRFT